MSYAAQPPVTTSPPGSRPASVTTAVALLWAMAAAGLAYAIGMVSVAPSTVSRFRDATGGSEQAESFISVIWLDAALAAVIAILVVALFVVLGLGLRRGSRLARGVTFAVCVLGILGGFGSLGALGLQRSGEALAGSVGEALGSAYPSGWISLNVAVAAAQVLAYLVMGALLLMTPRQFFGGEPAPAGAAAHPGFGFDQAAPVSGAAWQSAPSSGAGWPAPAAGWPAAPASGAGYPGPGYPGSGYPPAGHPGVGHPGAAYPGAGSPGTPGAPGYGPPPGVPGFGPPPGAPGYGPPPGAPGFGPPPGVPGYGPAPVVGAQPPHPSAAPHPGAAPYPGPGAYPPPGYDAAAVWGPPPATPAPDNSAYMPSAPPPPAAPPAAPGGGSADAGSSPEPTSAPLNRNESSVTTPITDTVGEEDSGPTQPQQKSSEPDQSSSPRPPAGAEDEFWSRPSDGEPRNSR